MRTLPTFILGASDPEMVEINRLLHAVGAPVQYATAPGKDGTPRRVHPGNAYAATGPVPDGPVVLIECGGPALDALLTRPWSTRIDHHRVGDPGYGAPPSTFLPDSSLGQTIAFLGQLVDYPLHWRRVAVPRHPHWCGSVEHTPNGWVARTTGWDGDPGQDRDDTATAATIPVALVLVAAADHCLAAAYAGQCPGVNPRTLAKWRDRSRAAFQCIPVKMIRATRVAAEALILGADRVDGIADLRAHGAIPELPEAAARLGVAVLYRLPVGHGANKGARVKVGIIGAGEGTAPGCDPIKAFLAGTLVPGLADLYGDPARGFAGGYESCSTTPPEFP